METAWFLGIFVEKTAQKQLLFITSWTKLQRSQKTFQNGSKFHANTVLVHCYFLKCLENMHRNKTISRLRWQGRRQRKNKNKNNKKSLDPRERIFSGMWRLRWQGLKVLGENPGQSKKKWKTFCLVFNWLLWSLWDLSKSICHIAVNKHYNK